MKRKWNDHAIGIIYVMLYLGIGIAIGYAAQRLLG